MTENELTPDQQEAFRQLKTFMLSRSESIFILTGHAGTGKTTLIRFFSQWLKSEKYEAIYLSTTGRSARILSEKAKVDATTLHSRLYVLNELNSPVKSSKDPFIEESGQMCLFFGLKQKRDDEPNIDLFIVDEASMISDIKTQPGQALYFGGGNVLVDLLSHAGNSKILFVGDPYQLPPVALSSTYDSPALSSSRLQTHYNKRVHNYQLKKIVRQAEDNPIILLSEYLREQLDNFDPSTSVRFPRMETVNIQFLEPGVMFFKKYMDIFEKYGPDSLMHINHAAGSAFGANTYIRLMLWKENKSKFINPNERLMVIQNASAINVLNGDIIKVEGVPQIEHRQELKLSFYNFSFRKQNGGVLKYKMLADFPFQKTQVLDREVFNRLMKDFDKRARARGLVRNSKEYLEALSDDPYANALRCKFAYATTCHKAQGGEWEHVFLNISPEYLYQIDKEYVLRWLYTAVSRSSNMLYISDSNLFV